MTKDQVLRDLITLVSSTSMIMQHYSNLVRLGHLTLSNGTGTTGRNRGGVPLPIQEYSHLILSRPMCPSFFDLSIRAQRNGLNVFPLEPPEA